MIRHLDNARKARGEVRVCLVKGLARCRRAILGGRRETAAEFRPFVFPHPRTQHRQELQRLEREHFPLWRPDPAKVRALQSHCA